MQGDQEQGPGFPGAEKARCHLRRHFEMEVELLSSRMKEIRLRCFLIPQAQFVKRCSYRFDRRWLSGRPEAVSF